MIRRFLVAGIASLLVSSSLFAQVLVDTFTNAQTTITRNSVGATTVLQTDASAIGGNRRVTNTYVSGSNNFNLISPGGQFQSSADGGVIGNYLLEYGSQTQLNQSIVGTNAFLFDRVFLDLNSTVSITIISGNGAVTATLNNFALTGGGGPSSTVTLMLSSFTNGGSLNLADIDQVNFQFNAAQQSTQFTLDNLRFANITVPEPATMTLLGLTGVVVGAGAWYRRRKAARLEPRRS